MSHESIEQTYRERTPTSRQMFEDGRAVNAGAAKGAFFYAPYPITLKRGSGCNLEDVDGNTYIDFSNHHTSQVLGHNHPAIMEAIQTQMADGIAIGGPTGIETRMAELMCSRVPSLDRVRFVNSGTEATLHAIRIARSVSGKPKVVKFEGGYHGSHDAVEISVAPPMDAAGDETEPNAVPQTGGLAQYATDDTIVLSYHDEENLERTLSHHKDEIACVILDPRAGVLPVRPEFMRRVREVTQELGILLVFDEIVAFRQGTGGYQEYAGIRPDLTCYGKIVGGGFPVGAYGGRADLMDQVDNTHGPVGVFQSGTHSGHAVAMAAGIATLETLTEDAYAYLNSLGQRLKKGLDKMCADKGVVAQTLATGSVFGIHYGVDRLETYRDQARSNKTLAHSMFLSLLNQGYFMAQGLSMCAISLPTQESHIDDLIDAMAIAYDDATS